MRSLSLNQWRDLDYGASAPWLFPGDEQVLERESGVKSCVYQSLKEYCASPEYECTPDHHLHLGLLPIPYIGDLANASVYILMLNPGFSPGDYFAEYEQPKSRDAAVANLKQDFKKTDYPFVCLNPEFAWSPGYTYWQKKFDDVIRRLSEDLSFTYRNAARLVAQNVACLELFPYHSRSFAHRKILSKLPSVEAMRDYVRSQIKPKAMSGEATVIVTRSVKDWGIDWDDTNAVVYTGAEARAAHLSSKSRGGKAIYERLLGLRSCD